MSDGSWTECCLPDPVSERRWARLWASFSQSSGELSVGICQDGVDDTADTTFTGSTALSDQKINSIVVAACDQGDRHMHFNGKIERPTIYSAQLGSEILLDSTEAITTHRFLRAGISVTKSRVRVSLTQALTNSMERWSITRHGL